MEGLASGCRLPAKTHGALGKEPFGWVDDEVVLEDVRHDVNNKRNLGNPVRRGHNEAILDC